MNKDLSVLRGLASRYAQITAESRMEHLRELWRGYCASENTRPPVLLDIGLWQAWAKQMFSSKALECEDPFYQEHERRLKFLLLHASLGDDTVFEPWYTISAEHTPSSNAVWGIEYQKDEIDRGPGIERDEGMSYHLHPVLNEESDLETLRKPKFSILENSTNQKVRVLEEAFGESLPIHVDRGPFLKGFSADISTTMARLRGLEEMMLDMYERPEWLHDLAQFLQGGILEHQDACEREGNISYASGFNQAMPYHRDLPDPRPNEYGARRDELWGFFAAQEFTDVSPAMHEEFLLQYQIPIMEKWAFVSYGCCENLTRKIDLLRKIKNLRRIGVTPFADLLSCSQQIGGDYLLSWRPKPTDIVCNQFDLELSRERLKEGANICRANGNHYDVMLKDVEALAAGPESLRQWVEVARKETEE